MKWGRRSALAISFLGRCLADSTRRGDWVWQVEAVQAAAASMHTWLLSLRTSESEGVGASSPPPQGVITLKPASKDEPHGATVYDEFLPLPLSAVRLSSCPSQRNLLFGCTR